MKVLFPNKLNDLVFYFSDFINKKMITPYKKKRINKKSLRLQILTLLKIRFSILNEYKSVIKESMVFLCSPSKQLLSSKLIFKNSGLYVDFQSMTSQQIITFILKELF